MGERLQAVNSVVEGYLDALFHRDASTMAEVFHRDALMSTVRNGVLVADTWSSWSARLKDTTIQSPSSKKQIREEYIERIEFVGSDLATVNVRVAIDPHTFNDILLLACISGRWWIVSKVFTGWAD